MTESRKEYLKLYYQKNKEKCKEKSSKNYEKNKDIRRIQNKQWVENNKEKHKELCKEWRNNNKDKINESAKLKIQSDPLFKLKNRLRNSLREQMKRNGYKKNTKTQLILGCSFEEFKSYLESKFESWMSWNNHGLYNGELNYGWDIDHIIPVSSATSEEEIIKINHYSNFQPLCSKINRDIKKDKLNFI